MIGVVLGNGPSKHLYDRSGDFTLGCNIPGKEFSVDATVICDEEIIWILKNDPTVIDCPLIISNKAFEKLKELRLEKHFVIHHVFKAREWYNTAHYAAEYLAEFGCDQIDVWGCDSIFENNISSTTDVYVKKEDTVGDRFTRQWRRIWNEIFDSHSNIKFTVIRIKS
jgi:hypothetical protein